MKKIFILIVAVAALALAVTSCSGGQKCPAYSNSSSDIEQSSQNS